MPTSLAAAGLDLSPGSHACWVVGSPTDYVRRATALLVDARAAKEKPVVFGPRGSDALEALGPLATVAADPLHEFAGGRGLDPEAMYAMFHEQSELARREGYERLRVVADMDWLLPAAPTREDVTAFELLLDRHVAALDATVVCAYRAGSFDADAIAAVRSVHPTECGTDDEPPFRLVAGRGGTWRLSGEADFSVEPELRAALTAAATDEPCLIDASELEFMDVAALRALARASADARGAVRLLGARPVLRRCWELAGLAELAPHVEFAT